MSSTICRSKAVKRKRINCPQITTYMRLVEQHKIEACKEQHQLVAYVRKTFAEEKLIIDFKAISDYEKLETCFPFKLFPWEWFVFTLSYCVFREDGRPRWDEAFIYVGRGSGKNGFASYTSFCLISPAHGIRDYDVDICANSEDQAKTSFTDVYDILESNTKLYKKAFDWNLVSIQNKRTRSRLRYRTDNPKSKDGLRSGMVIFDEVHQYENWKNVNVFTTGLGKKPHPRRLYITTDGDVRDGVLDSLLAKAFAILNGEKEDNGFLPFLCRLDSDEEVHDEKMWEKAVPSLRYREDLLIQIRKEYGDYIENPAIASSFMTKRMNRPQGNPDLEVTSWDNILATNRELPDLTGLPCVCGIDFAKTTDFISVVLLFRVDGVYYVKHHSWFCNRSADAGRIKVPLQDFEKLGILTIVDDVEVHPSIVADWIQEQSTVYNIRKVGIDLYRHTLMKHELERIGYKATDKDIKLVRPSDQMLLQPKVNSIFVNQNIIWGDDPLMRWFTNNTCLVSGQHGNYTFGKIEPRSRKTDGFMAFIAAMAVEDAIPAYKNVQFIAPICI